MSAGLRWVWPFQIWRTLSYVGSSGWISWPWKLAAKPLMAALLIDVITSPPVYVQRSAERLRTLARTLYYWVQMQFSGARSSAIRRSEVQACCDVVSANRRGPGCVP